MITILTNKYFCFNLFCKIIESNDKLIEIIDNVKSVWNRCI